MNFLETLEMLDDWKKLPAYKAEPRVDFIVSRVFPELMKERYNSKIKLIIPELPIRLLELFTIIQVTNHSK